MSIETFTGLILPLLVAVISLLYLISLFADIVADRVVKKLEDKDGPRTHDLPGLRQRDHD